MQLRTVGVTLVLGLVACNGNGGLPSKPLPSSPGTSRVYVPVHMFIPNRIGRHRLAHQRLTRRSRGVLHQLFIAANSAGIELAVYPSGLRTGLVSSLVGNISSSSPDCTAGSGGRTCSLALPVPPGGPYDFVIATFDQAPAGGTIPAGANQLGAAIASETIATGKANSLNITVGGVVASTTVFAPQPDVFHSIASRSERLIIGANDADGNVIATDGYVDQNGNTVTITPAANANAGSTITFAPAHFSTPQSDGVLLQYSALAASNVQFENGFYTAITAPTGTSATSGKTYLTVYGPRYPLSLTTDTGPEDVALLDGSPYITASNAVDYVREGVRKSYSLPGGAQPVGIAVDNEGTVWFAESGIDALGEVFPEGGPVVSNAQTFAPGTEPERLTNGPDGALWLTEYGTNAIARVPVSAGVPGAVTTYPLPTDNAGPEGITVGPDGALWFTECAVGKIGRIPTTAVAGSSAQIKEFALPDSATSHPLGIVAGADGALWTTDPFSPVIRRITTGGTITEFSVPYASGTGEIASAPDGQLWFTMPSVDDIGRILPTATPATPNIFYIGAYGGGGAKPAGIAVGTDGSVYYTEFGAGYIIRMQ